MFKYKPISYMHIDHVTSNFSSIYFSVFNDGTSKELLCLDGTIPVTYKGVLIVINRYILFALIIL